tara:strand:+ start:88 stop:555 length:468 start_codon:yes stop_codon:yes gene_type:complete
MIKQDRNKYGTPIDFYDKLNQEFNFDHDPCPLDWNVNTHDDGLTSEWGNRNFVNPPYGRGMVQKWIEKADIECKKGKLVVMLINVSTDTVVFHKYIYQQPHIELRFIKGRLRFFEPESQKQMGPNPRPSMLVIWHPKKSENQSNDSGLRVESHNL